MNPQDTLLKRLSTAKEEIAECERLIEAEKALKAPRPVTEGWFIEETPYGILLNRYEKGSTTLYLTILKITEEGVTRLGGVSSVLDGIETDSEGRIALR